MYGLTHRFGDGSGSVLVEDDVVEDITDKVAKLIISELPEEARTCAVAEWVIDKSKEKIRLAKLAL